MNKLKEIRELMNMPQERLAALANTSQPQIVKLEKGERKMTKEWAVRLARVLGVHPARLLFSDDELAAFSGYGSEESMDRPWESLIAQASAIAKRDKVPPQVIHAKLQDYVPMRPEQVIAMLSQQPRIRQELAALVSEQILEQPDSPQN